jgi:quinol monooxygenase YgiN
MSKVAVIAKLAAKDGQRDQLAKALEQSLGTAAGEEGTIMYILHADANDPNLLWFYELYRDADALKAHAGSEAMKALGSVVAPFAAGRPELIHLEPLGGKGL